MLAIPATHPIQYHVPLWQKLAEDGRVPFEVWYLSEHATKRSRDREFQQDFAWDLDMLKGYPHRFIKTPPGATPNTPLRMRIADSLPDLFREHQVRAVWVQGWQVAAYWQAVWAAKKAGLSVWLRGESNVLRQQGARNRGWGGLKESLKRILLGQLFNRVDEFLCIGTANRELYRTYGVPETKLHMTPYAVDNERFATQAANIRSQRSEIRSQWKIPEDAFCVLFCGKFIPKKRPLDLIEAAQLLLRSRPELKLHLLFAGSGELGAQMRGESNVVFDAEAAVSSPVTRHSSLPNASFAGFLNQTEISKAYVAGNILVLPSDYGETWGLVVNEAMASGLPCIISDRCGCAMDLGLMNGNAVYACGSVASLTKELVRFSATPEMGAQMPPSLEVTVDQVAMLYREEVVLP